MYSNSHKELQINSFVSAQHSCGNPGTFLNLSEIGKRITLASFSYCCYNLQHYKRLLLVPYYYSNYYILAINIFITTNNEHFTSINVKYATSQHSMEIRHSPKSTVDSLLFLVANRLERFTTRFAKNHLKLRDCIQQTVPLCYTSRYDFFFNIK